MTAPSVVTVTTPQTNAAQTLAINMPASIVAGNLLLVFLAHGGTMTTPSGWTVKDDTNSIAVYYRWATGSEPSTYTFTTSTLSTITQAVAYQVSGSLGSGDPFDGTNTGANTSTITPPVTVTTTVADTLLLFVDAKNASRTANVAPSGFTIDTPNPGVTHAFHKTQAVAGSTGSLTASFTSGSNHSTMLAALKPSTLVVLTRTGSAGTTVTGTAASVEVEKSAASAGLTVAASAVARAVVPVTAAVALVLTATATAVPVEVRTGTATVSVAATATAVPVAVATGTATLTLSGDATGIPDGGIHARTATGLLQLVGTADVTSGSVVSRTGMATLTLTGTAISRAVIFRTGTATLKLNGTATATPPAGIYTRTGFASLAIGAAANAVTVHPRTGLASLSINQTNIVKVVVVEVRTGTATLELEATGTATAVEVRDATATLTLAAHDRPLLHPATIRVNITERPRTAAVTEQPRTATITDRTRKTTITEA